MANNPVQIVLNDKSYIGAPDPGRAGYDKDFFADNDSGFARHKEAMLARLDAIDKSLGESTFGPLCYVRVRMRIEALAKSYRPNRSLFLSDQFPCVGAGAPGELYFRLPRYYLHRLRERFNTAELQSETRFTKKGERFQFVSRARSELGAIEDIEIAPPNAKRDFSASAAVEALLHPSAASGYIVELFEQRPLEVAANDDVLGLRVSFQTLRFQLGKLGNGIYAALLPSPGGVPSLEVRITGAQHAPVIEDRRAVQTQMQLGLDTAEPDKDPSRHEHVLSMLASHPLVRRIRFPVMIETSSAPTIPTPIPFKLPGRISGATYPRVGVIDTGTCDFLEQWVVYRHDFLDQSQCDHTHGTLVSGVLIGAQGANNSEIGRESDGCEIVDIPLMPAGRFSDVYGPRGFEAFLEELDAAIMDAKRRHGVRVFNMSLNIRSPVEPHQYGIYAARLDEIQDRHGVLIVNSAGNLDAPEWRAPWPKTPSQILRALAGRVSHDAIYMPCESARALAVGALNPPNSAHEGGAPTTYTRRGPGLRVGVKPDLAHYGGTGDVSNPSATSLASCGIDGMRKETRGTSFAAPLVAKTLASLDAMTNGRLETRTLRAFTIHNAVVPECLQSRSLRDIARQFVGFGQPTDATAMLETEDHAITLVFESRLSIGERRAAILRFPFAWPTSLVDPSSLSCRGNVKMTLVYDPPLDQAFGTEFVRVNLDAKLRQRQETDLSSGAPSWSDKLDQGFLPRANGLTPPERALISHGLKWWPTKRYQKSFGDGVGASTEWQIQVESIVRAEAEFPAEGVPFSLILTIEDPDQTRPVFQELRRQLVSNRVDLQDVRAAVRLRPR